ncbi:hypothetical protein QYE76_008334 [Lolium multiflorum]|uniref:Reverse transcriptase Ty1/copia-type domain-containing protein n=1 Tax=Lolium multiflorum TaxID=4521 RepID=A0AAD8VCH0_LOLMU|nr:hypothetical protein QYE76_008334 [Lolium multiflorum]
MSGRGGGRARGRGCGRGHGRGRGRTSRSPSPATPSSSPSEMDVESGVLFEFVLVLKGDPRDIHCRTTLPSTSPATTARARCICGRLRATTGGSSTIYDARGKMYLNIGWEKFAPHHASSRLHPPVLLLARDMSVKVFNDAVGTTTATTPTRRTTDDEECCFFAANTWVYSRTARRPAGTMRLAPAPPRSAGAGSSACVEACAGSHATRSAGANRVTYWKTQSDPVGSGSDSLDRWVVPGPVRRPLTDTPVVVRLTGIVERKADVSSSNGHISSDTINSPSPTSEELTKELAKFTTATNKMGLDDLLSKQRSNNQKFGLGYAPKSYKKNNYKKEKPAQDKNKKGYSSGGTKWVFDSGCTNHMTGGRGVLDQFIEGINKKSSITFGDNSKGKSKDETHREFITFAKKAQLYESRSRKFELSMMGELKFFLGFQVRQLAKGTFISQEKYVKDMLKKFNITNASPMKTPMPVKGQLGSCDGEKDVDIKMFRESLISKSGDSSEVRNYHLNLMYYCHPDRIRKIDGCDLIHYELKRSVMGRMTPNYARYVQRLINHMVPPPLNTLDQRVIMEPFKFSTQDNRPYVPTMMPSERLPRNAMIPQLAPLLGAQARRDTEEQNEFMAGLECPLFLLLAPEMEPVVAPAWEMPPITDEMLQNFRPPCMLMVAFLLGLLVTTMMIMMKRMKVLRMRVMMARAHIPLGMSSIDGCGSISPLFFAFLVFRCQRGRRE